MKINLGLAAVMAVGATSAAVGALDAVPHMVGGYTDLTRQVLNNCTALHTIGDPITFDGVGTGAAENAMKVIGSGSTQLIGPMTRPLISSICVGPTPAQRAGAEGMVVALQAVSVLANANTAGPDGIDYPGVAGDPANHWRDVLRLLYAGMSPRADGSEETNLFTRDCNGAARRALVNDWDSVFHGTVTSCTDSHPSVAGVGAAGYDQNNAIVEPGVRHAFRLDDSSGMTDVFTAQLRLPGVSFAQGAPTGSTVPQAAAYRALAGSPFCNNKRPDDDWQPVTLAANAVLGFNASQIPQMTNIGVPSGAGSGLGLSSLLAGSGNAKNLSPYLNEYSDQDPIRRKCVGRGNNASAELPMEQVCAADGTLGVVLPITVPPDLTIAERYPSLPCEPGRGFFFGPALTRPTTDPVRCPNGDVTQDSQCLLPVRSDPTQPSGIAFDCINPPGNVPQAVFDTDGDGSQFPDAPGTDGRSDVDGRVYNLTLRKADGTIQLATRPNPASLGVVQVPVAAAFYRIHSTRSLLLPPSHKTTTCATQDDSSDQINCLLLASPCSLGYTTRGSVSSNPGTVRVAINGIPNSFQTIGNLMRGGAQYPMARKFYLNTVQGFEVLHNSDPLVPNTDAEEEMAKCFATLPFNGTINVESPSLGLTRLPPALGSTVEKPVCEDFNGALPTNCSDATNTDACLGNELISGGAIPTSYCDNGLIDGAETGPDVCPASTPTCNPATHHCQ